MEFKANILPLIPYPQEVRFLSGVFVWSHQLTIDSRISPAEIQLFLDSIPAQLRPQLQDGPENSCVSFHRDPTFRKEAYELKILPQQHVEIVAADSTGLFYALQTLRQLILADDQPGVHSVSLACVHILDEPQFAWRGFMLDEARHFQGMQTVKDLLDWMAYLKLNTFHWHLSDDQGWRMEIKQYPRLIEVGANRPASKISGFLRKKLNQTPHSGYYTQDEIQDIIHYAAARHIQIVPEIEIPGHALAALAAYPELGCRTGPYQVSPHWGIHADILCGGKPGTTTFLLNVLDEVVDLFPGGYIHTGGDEAPKKRWRNCPDCQKLARENGLTKINQLQTILTNRVSQFLNARGRILIGWNEMLADNLDPDAVVQYWVGKEKTLVQHIRSGRKAILSNFAAYYLDHSYTHSPLDKVYQYEPVFDRLEPEYHKNILGIETPLWTEFIPSRQRLDWQIFPRLFAVAETAWLEPDKKDLNSFHQRLTSLLNQLNADHIGYALLIDANPSWFKQLSGPVTLLQSGQGTQ